MFYPPPDFVLEKFVFVGLNNINLHRKTYYYQLTK